MKKFLCMIILAIASPALAGGPWESASRESAGLAPSPDEESGAVIQAYAAKVWGWRGIFADHTWLSVKPENASAYTVYQVTGFDLDEGLPALSIKEDIPDRHWFGNKPYLLVDLRGEKAQALVEKVDAAARAYPYPDEYLSFPGPNSNTFTAWVAMQVPELGLELPRRAVGKGYARRAADQ